MRIILILSLLVILCSAADGVSNLRRSVVGVPADVILKFKLASNKGDVYIKNKQIVKKNENEFTYYEAEKSDSNGNSKYTPKSQFECKGKVGQQTLTTCTTTGVKCTDTLSTFTINYNPIGDEDPETDTPPSDNAKQSDRELITYTAEFDGSGPDGATVIQIVTTEESAKDIMEKYTKSTQCSTGSDKTEPVPKGKVLKFVLKSGETVFLSDTKALKQNGEGYTYYDVGKDDTTTTTQSTYKLTPVYICDGNKQSDSLTTCKTPKEGDCKEITYNIQYIASGEKYEFLTKLDNVEITESNEENFNWHDKESDCPTGSDTTTTKVPDDKVLKFVLGTGENAETVYLSNTQGLKQKEKAYSYYTIVKDDSKATYSTYTLTPKYVCDGKSQSDSLTTCNKQKDGECKEITYNIQYTKSTSKAEFVTPDSLKSITITILSSDSDVKFGAYDEANDCPTGSGDGKIQADDLSAIPKNANVKQNTTGNSYELITDNVYYMIDDDMQLAIPVTKIQGEHNSTYTIKKDSDFIEKSTGLKGKDNDNSFTEELKCPAGKNKFMSLIWLKRNCNETKIDEKFDKLIERLKLDEGDKSFILGVNASIVYFYVDQLKQFIKFGEIVENIDIMEDKSWFVYPSLLLSIIFIIIF